MEEDRRLKELELKIDFMEKALKVMTGNLNTFGKAIIGLHERVERIERILGSLVKEEDDSGMFQ